MPDLPVVSGDEARRALERAGWLFMRQAGSHMVLRKPGFRLRVSIPRHKELDRGLLRAIIRKAGMTVQEFADLL